MKKIWACILIGALLVCSAGLISAQAAGTTLSGVCGENLTWKLENGTLTIDGTGRMQSYRANGLGYIPEDVPPTAPWYDHRDEVRSIVISEGVTEIGTAAFEFCRNAADVTLPQTLTTISTSAFSYCERLDSVTVPKSVTSIRYYAFRGAGKVFADADNPVFAADENGVLYSKDHTLLKHYPVNLRQSSFTVPEGVTTVEEYAFAECRNLRTVTIPGTLTKWPFAFQYCPDLESVVVEEGVKSIDTYAFYGCRNLRSVTLPESLKTIQSAAFSGTALEYLHIPSGVTTIATIIVLSPPRYYENEKNTELPYMQSFYICSDKADCAAKAYADENHFRFYVCGGDHSESTVHRHNGTLQKLLYAFCDSGRRTEFLSALLAYAKTMLRLLLTPKSVVG